MMRAAAAAALVLPLAALAACADAPTPAKATPPPVRIGAIYNLTGDQSSLDSPSLDGARLAVERINARGGLLGRRVELLERDGQTNEADVRRAAASLVASGVSAIVGLSDTDQVLAAAPIAARAGVPFVTSGATSPRLTRQVPDWLFLACFGDNAQAAASAQYATDQLGARTAAVIYDRELDYTRLLARYFERSFRAQGGQVLVTADYEKAAHAVDRLRGKDEPTDERPRAAATGLGRRRARAPASDRRRVDDGESASRRVGRAATSGDGDESSERRQERRVERRGRGESSSTSSSAVAARPRRPARPRPAPRRTPRPPPTCCSSPPARRTRRASCAPCAAPATGSPSWAATASTRRRWSRPPRRRAARSTTRPTPPSA